MEDDKLVQMANQIATYFQSYPPAEAAASIADHLLAFWSPVMCSTLASRLGRTSDGAAPLVVQAGRTPQFRAAVARRARVAIMAAETG